MTDGTRALRGLFFTEFCFLSAFTGMRARTVVLNNTREAWGALARGLHWFLAILIPAQGVLGWFVHEMENSPAKIQWMTSHKSLGITILMLVVLRLIWRWLQPVPAEPPGSAPWERRASRVAHVGLYLLMIAIPLSGWLAASTTRLPWKFWWWFEWPRLAQSDKVLHDVAKETHEVLIWVLVAVVAVHVGAALRHHFVKRTNVLERMWLG